MLDIFKTIFEMSCTGAIVIGIVILLRFLMRKLPRRFSCFLWIIPAIRLLCPVTLASALSIFNLKNLVDTPKIPELPTYPEGAALTFEITPENVNGEPQELSTLMPGVIESIEIPEPINYGEIVMNILPWIWLAGFAVMSIYVAVSYIRVWLRVRKSRHLQDNIYICEGIPSPFVFGIIKPKIYVPSGVSGVDLEYILSHENAHIRRGDHISKLLATIILAVHWFNPMVWLAYRLVTVDIELSCDQRALGGYDLEHRKEYARVLLNMATAQNKLTLGGVLSFGEIGIKTRIKSVLSMKKPKLVACIAAVAVIIIAAACMLTKAQTENYPELSVGKYMVDDIVYQIESLSNFVYNGKFYNVYEDEFVISTSSDTLYRFPLTEWEKMPYTEEKWAKLFENEEDVIPFGERKGKYIMELSASYFLMSMEDSFWLVHTKVGGEQILEIFQLSPYNEVNNFIEMDSFKRWEQYGFYVVQAENGYEIRHPDTDLYITFTKEPDDFINVCRDRENGTEFLHMPHIGGFNYYHSLPELKDITGDGVGDLIVTTGYTGTGVVESGFSAVDGATFTALEVDADAINEIVKKEAAYIAQYDSFSQYNSHLTGSLSIDNPENGLSIWGGVSYNALDSEKLRGYVLFCMADSEIKAKDYREPIYSIVYQIVLEFDYDGEKLVPELKERYYMFEDENMTEFYTEYFNSLWNTMLGTGESEIPLDMFFSNYEAYRNISEAMDLYNGTQTDYSKIQTEVTDIIEIGHTDSGRKRLYVTYDVFGISEDGSTKPCDISSYTSYIEIDNDSRIYCDIPMWGGQGYEAVIINYVKNPWEFGWLADKKYLNGEYIESTDIGSIDFISMDEATGEMVYEVEYEVIYKKEYEHVVTEPSGKKQKYFTLSAIEGEITSVTSVGY